MQFIDFELGFSQYCEYPQFGQHQSSQLIISQDFPSTQTFNDISGGKYSETQCNNLNESQIDLEKTEKLSERVGIIQQNPRYSNKLNQIRFESIIYQRQLLMKRLKELDQEEQKLGMRRAFSPNNIKSKNYQHRTRPYSASRVSQTQKQNLNTNNFKINPQVSTKAQNPLTSVQHEYNPYITTMRPEISQLQKDYLSKIDTLTEQELILALKGFGMKKGAKKKMVFELKRVHDYLSNPHVRNPFGTNDGRTGK